MNAKRPRTHAELEELLAEQLAFLESSADAFDNGFEGEAKRLALAVRILFHDTKSSSSLLGQLSRKSLLCSDTALPPEPGNQMPEASLVYIAMGGDETKYVAMLDGTPFTRKVPFEEWWNSNVFKDNNGVALSRKDIILTAANQDGGAHVDPTLDERYARLCKDNSLGMVAADASGSRPMPGPERAAIRQIAHEVLKSCKPGYVKNIDRGFVAALPIVTRGSA